MPFDTCLLPGPETGLGELFYCTALLVFGDIYLAAMVFFIAVLFIMWKARIPMEAAYPFGIILLFVMANTVGEAFQNLAGFALFATAVIFTMALIHFARR